jgi:hypothetical protein
MYTFPIQLFVDSTGRVKTTLTGSAYYGSSSRISLKRGDTAAFEVKFLTRGTNTPFRLPNGSLVQIAMKQLNSYATSTAYAVFASTAATPATDSAPYVLTAPISGATLNALFTAATEPAYVDLMFELSWSEDGTNWCSTYEPIQARVYNEVIAPATSVPPTISALSLSPSYNHSFLLAKDGTQELPVDMQPIFGLKLGDISQFKVTLAMCPRKVGVSANYDSDCLVEAEFLACVDLSDVGNYNTLANVGVLKSTTRYGTNADNCGLFTLNVVPGGLATENAVFKQSTALKFVFTSTDSSPTRTVDLYDVVCFLKVELIGKHYNWID